MNDYNSKQWNDRYKDLDFYYGTEPNDFLKDCASLIKSYGKVLCLAEGEGRNAVYLASLGFKVTAVDGSPVALEKLQKLAVDRGVEVSTQVCDLERFSIEASQWDAIISIWCHIPLTLRTRIHLEAVQGLKSGGYFILESYRPKQLAFKTGGPPTADLMTTQEELKTQLFGLKFEILREIDREIHEGKGHNGMSAVVQVLGKKEVTHA